MNICKKIFCRTVQLGFRAAMPVLPYRDPKIYEKVSDAADILCELKIDRVMIVTDRFLRTSGATGELERSLEEKGIACCVYDETRPNPTADNVEKARKLYLQEYCRGLIAFGGGSSMDCAKAVGARVVYPRKTLAKLSGNLKVWRKLPPLIAIPTTAGTGSETTVTAVITDERTKHKCTMNNFPFIPPYAILDPAVTVSLPPHLTATTGMDALTHAVEAYIGHSTTKETRRLALDATSLIFSSIETAYSCPEDLTARKNMLLASHKAGLAFSKSYVGYVHAVAHSLGGQYNIPHGLANSVLLPIVLEDYGECIHEKLKDLAVAAGISDKTEDKSVAANKFIAAVRAKNKAMGIRETLDGIEPSDIPQMANYADKEGNPLYPVPKFYDAKELERFYHLVRSE